jgi:UDP-glucose 4-epimerase
MDRLRRFLRGSDTVWHLAANADIRGGSNDTQVDMRDNVLCTHKVLEAMRLAGVRRIVFSSTGSVYGASDQYPTPESSALHVTSLYAASKVAAESFISAYASHFGIWGAVCRLSGVLGEGYRHGHVIDMYRKLVNNPSRLSVLGNGQAAKMYVYVEDCVDAMLRVWKNQSLQCEVVNVGTETQLVAWSVYTICKILGVNPVIEWGTRDFGWTGDNPRIDLDVRRLRMTGWTPSANLEESLRRTLEYLKAHSDRMPENHEKGVADSALCGKM